MGRAEGGGLPEGQEAVWGRNRGGVAPPSHGVLARSKKAQGGDGHTRPTVGHAAAACPLPPSHGCQCLRLARAHPSDAEVADITGYCAFQFKGGYPRPRLAEAFLAGGGESHYHPVPPDPKRIPPYRGGHPEAGPIHFGRAPVGAVVGRALLHLGAFQVRSRCGGRTHGG